MTTRTPGAAMELHDHGGSSCALAVVTGELVETSAVSAGDTRGGNTPLETPDCGLDVGLRDDPRADAANSSLLRAVSLHVYAPRLTSMTYDRVEDGLLVAERAARYALGEAEP